MKFIKCINLDLNRCISRKPIEVHQGEKDSRYIKAFITFDDEPFIIPNTYTAKVDATLCEDEKNLILAEDVACEINPNDGDTSIVLIPITGLMCAKGGKVELSLEFIENSSTVKTQKLYITVIEDKAEGAEYAEDVDHTARLGVNLKDKATGEVSTLYVEGNKLFLDGKAISNGGDTSGGSSARISEVKLTSNGWQGETSPYSQIVNIEGVTPYSQVDLTPNIEQLAIFYQKDLAFVTENENGVVTVYALGDKPKNDYTIQVTITEVIV